MKAIKRFFGLVFLIIFVIIGLIVWSGYSKYETALKKTPLPQAAEQIRSIDNYTPLYAVPEIYKNAVIAAEDRRFYLHNGFDIIGTARAIVVCIKTKELSEGGSTITQQLAKNMYFMNDNSPTRKLAEIFMALKIEQEYSKDEILELYMNGIYYGSGYYNIYDAAVGYFAKTPDQMNDYEATLLAGVPNAPSVYSPKVNPDLATKRQEKIIDCLVECDYISEDEGIKILQE